METKTLDEIEQINKIVCDFANKIAHEHHKPRDGCWQIKFRPAYEESFAIVHEGYWLEDIWIEGKELLPALKKFKKEIQKRTEKEIDAYDFENHCIKE